MSADTAASSLDSTSFCVIDSSAGRWKPFTAAVNAATANNNATLGFGSSEFTTSASEPSVISASQRSNSLRRSSESASAPPQSAVSASGTSCTLPIKPTAADDFVSANTCTGSAT